MKKVKLSYYDDINRKYFIFKFFFSANKEKYFKCFSFCKDDNIYLYKGWNIFSLSYLSNIKNFNKFNFSHDCISIDYPIINHLKHYQQIQLYEKILHNRDMKDFLEVTKRI